MNLPERNQWALFFPVFDAELLQKSASISFHSPVRVLACKAEIESAAAVEPRESSRSGAESMNQPWNGSEVFRTENIYPALVEILHYDILEQARLLMIMLRPMLDVVYATSWPARRHRQAVALCLLAMADR